MARLDWIFTLKIIVLAIVAFLVITAWDEVLDRTIFKWFELDREKISSWVIIAVVSTVILIALLMFFNIEAHDVLGISETVDTSLTGKVERTVRGRVIHSKAI